MIEGLSVSGSVPGAGSMYVYMRAPDTVTLLSNSQSSGETEKQLLELRMVSSTAEAPSKLRPKGRPGGGWRERWHRL